jgi:hypothetical protein
MVGSLARPDGPEGCCTKMFLKVGANISLCLDVPADTWNDQMARKVGAPRCSWRMVRTSYCAQMFQRTLGTTRWPGRLVHQDVPEGWCEHLTVFRCSGGHLERPDGPEGWCEYIGVPRCSGMLVWPDVPVCWCDQMLRKVSYILVTNDSHYEILILMAVKKTDWKLIVIYYFLLINV